MYRLVKFRINSRTNEFFRLFSNGNLTAESDSCSTKQHIVCWNCKELLKCIEDKFFCANCSLIQPPVKCVNYFQYLGLGEPSYDIDSKKLTTEFRNLQQTLHPDKFTNKSDTEKIYSAQQASLVNNAYKTLLEPLSRALYLLKLFGTPLAEQDDVTDKEFLIEMLDLNEKVNESKDTEYLRKTDEEMKKVLDLLQESFKKAVDKKDYHSAYENAVKMKYYVTVRDNIAKKLGLY